MKFQPQDKVIGLKSRKIPIENSDSSCCGGDNTAIADEFNPRRLCTCGEKLLIPHPGRSESNFLAKDHDKTDLDKLDLRNHLQNLISCNPGISLKELIVRTGQKRSTIRYHLEKIESQGHVKSRNVAGKRCYCATSSPKAIIEDSFQKNDEMVHELLKSMSCEETPLHKIIQILQESCKLSRSGAYAVVKRAEHGGYIVRRKRQRTDMIQRVSS